MRRLTNQEVGNRIGLTHTAVSRIRSGQRRSSVSTIHAIAEAFGGDVELLVRYSSEPSPDHWVEYLERLMVTDGAAAVPA